MRVLWISTTPGLYNSDQWGYNGGGWIASLQRIVEKTPDVELALFFELDHQAQSVKKGNTHYYPVFTGKPSAFEKLKEYYGGYKQHDVNKYKSQLLACIHDFQPDVIHLFGIENIFADVLRYSPVSVTVHLQGLLSPYNTAFWPVGFNKSSFVWPPSVREWILRNGYIYAKKSMSARGKREKDLFKYVKHCMGRTAWDYEVSQLLAPQSHYVHVDEVLREDFYTHAAAWKRKEGKLIVTSTLSDTIYKGLDLVMNTANLLVTQTDVDFEWHVVGIDAKAGIVKFFERQLGLDSSRLNIVYDGVKDASQLCQHLVNSSVYVHTSYIDNSPNSVCEAQMLGMPVIATNVGGVSSLVENKKTGILVPANAPYELAYQIKQIATNPDFATNLGETAAVTAKTRHDKEKIVRELMAAYNAI